MDLQRPDLSRDHLSDADWYRANASAPGDPISCTSSTVAPEDEVRIHLREPALGAQIDATTDGRITLAHVGPSPAGTRLGLTTVDEFAETDYEFDVDVTTIDEASEAGARDRVPGPCFGDRLGQEGTHAWTFTAHEGQLVHLSLGTEHSQADRLVLEAPNGTEIASLTSGGDIARGTHTIDASGEWTLRLEAGQTAEAPTPSGYIVAFNKLETGDPEEEEGNQPCDPHCME